MYIKYVRALGKQKTHVANSSQRNPTPICANTPVTTRLLIPIDSYRSNTTSKSLPAKRGFYAERRETLSSRRLQQQSLMRAAVPVRGRASAHPPPLAHGQVRLSLSHLMMADSCQGFRLELRSGTALITTSEKSPQC